MIHHYQSQFPIAFMCRLLGASKSGYYAWKKQPVSKRAQEDAGLLEKIKSFFKAEKQRIGSIRVTQRLQRAGEHVGRHRVARIMREAGLRAKAAKKFKATTNSNHSLPVAPNLLQQNFSAAKPNEKWVSDITYLWTNEGWVYLAVVLDLYSRKVVGWSTAARMTTDLVSSALKNALEERNYPTGVILHSDRGSQYCSHDYQGLLKKHNLICSMSKKGDCFDNAAMETWNHSFKVEAIHGERFETRSCVEQVFWSNKNGHKS